MSLLLFLLLTAIYFLPTVIAWQRRKLDEVNVGWRRALLVTLVNLFFGWTLLGWIAAWAMAYSKKFGDLLATRAFGGRGLGGGYPASTTGGAPGDWDRGAPMPRSCSACGGSGEQPCGRCSGRGSWWEQPQTANAVAQLVTCSSCVSSGRITCTSCGGSGRSSYY